ncbi:hypothetical protein TNCV_2092151 [Trichonephila clavipes]|nr:hypothetical protein TNCV_2092151 [Trichonephila clavipes]
MDFHSVCLTRNCNNQNDVPGLRALVPAPGLDDKNMPHDEPGHILQHPQWVSSEGVARDKEIRLWQLPVLYKR